MQLRYLPPTRRSISQWGHVKPFGPHQLMKCSGSVQALHTSSRGASNTRSMTSACSVDVVGALLASAICVLLLSLLLTLLNLSEVFVQAIETLLPEAAISFQPFIGVLERARAEPAGAPLRLATARDQAGALQHLEVLGDRGQAHLEGLGQLRDGRLTRGQASENRAPGGIGEGGKGCAQLIGRHGYEPIG